MGTIDWRFALELDYQELTGSESPYEYGWLSTSSSSASQVLGKYEYIDWRDSRIQPTEARLTQLWTDYSDANVAEWEQLRVDRQLIFDRMDWIEKPSSKVTNKPEWSTYQKNLRELPENTTDPTNIIWPDQPLVKTPGHQAGKPLR